MPDLSAMRRNTELRRSSPSKDWAKLKNASWTSGVGTAVAIRLICAVVTPHLWRPLHGVQARSILGQSGTGKTNTRGPGSIRARVAAKTVTPTRRVQILTQKLGLHGRPCGFFI